MKKKISDIKGFLIDLDGTIYRGNKLLPGAVEFINALRNSDKKFLIISNNSSMSRKSHKNKLNKFGIEVDEDQIFTSTIATIIYLKKNYTESEVYPVGTPEFENELRSNGIRVSKNKGDVVLLGFDKTLTYHKIEVATRLINSGAKFIATHSDILCPTENGFIPDIGSMIALLEKATNISPKVIGKPNKDMVESALLKLAMSKNQVAMVGDRVYTDMKMAHDFGLISILVLSGETKEEDLSNMSPKPDYIFKSIREVISEL